LFSDMVRLFFFMSSSTVQFDTLLTYSLLYRALLQGVLLPCI